MSLKTLLITLPLAAHALSNSQTQSNTLKTSESGITRVVNMLKKMKSESQQALQDEKIKFSAFSEWCVQTKSTLGAQISELEETIEENEATNVAESASARAKADAVEKAQGEIAKLEAAIKKKEGIRKTEKEAYEVVVADYNDSVNAIEGALAVLKANMENAKNLAAAGGAGGAAASLVQMDHDSLVQIEESMKLSVKQKALVRMLIQGKNTLAQQQQPQAAAYKPQSSPVIELLEHLKAQFIEERNENIAAEAKKKGTHDTQVMAMRGEIQLFQEGADRDAGAQGKHEKMGGEAAQIVTDSKQTLTSTRDQKRTVTLDCNMKSDEFTARQVSREKELVALADAIKIVGGVSGHRTAAGTDSLIQIKSKITKSAAAKKSESFKHHVSFLQLQSDPSDSALQQQKLQRVSDFLQTRGRKLDSKELQLLSLSASPGSPFFKVMKMIETMVEKLKKQQLDETAKHDQCSKLMSENAQDIEATKLEIDRLQASVDEESGKATKQSERRKELEQASRDTQKEVNDATIQRNKERADNAATVQQCKEGETAIDSALEVLSEYYNNAGGVALLQTAFGYRNSGSKNVATSNNKASLIQTHTHSHSVSKSTIHLKLKAKQPETWSESTYSGNQEGAGNILNMLEVIQADFMRLRTDTESSEAASKAAYDKLVEESELAETEREAAIAHAGQAASRAGQNAAVSAQQLEEQKAVLATHLQQKQVIEQEKGCIVNSDKSPEELFKEKMAKRDAEIESLKEALQLLS